MCRFSKLLLFSFFFCKDGSDRLMKRASFSCCNFLCVVLATAYLKYRRCRLSCLPFDWHFFSLWHMHTHPIYKKRTKKENINQQWRTTDRLSSLKTSHVKNQKSTCQQKNVYLKRQEKCEAKNKMCMTRAVSSRVQCTKAGRTEAFCWSYTQPGGFSKRALNLVSLYNVQCRYPFFRLMFA